MVPAMTKDHKKYLTFALVLLATAVAGYFGLRYLDGVKASVEQQRAAQEAPKP